jgi:hypothetical protein
MDVNILRVACFELEDFVAAKLAFEKGLQLRRLSQKDTIPYERYIRKCDAELLGNKYVLFCFQYSINFKFLISYM